MNEKNLKQIKSIDEIFSLSEQRKAIYHKIMRRKLPAAVFENWQAKLLKNQIERGFLFVWESPKEVKFVIRKIRKTDAELLLEFGKMLNKIMPSIKDFKF